MYKIQPTLQLAPNCSLCLRHSLLNRATGSERQPQFRLRGLSRPDRGSSFLSDRGKAIDCPPESRTMQESESAIFLLNQQNCHSQRRSVRLPKSTFRRSRNDFVFHFAPFPSPSESEIITASRPLSPSQPRTMMMPTAVVKMHRSNRYTIITPTS